MPTASGNGRAPGPGDARPARDVAGMAPASGAGVAGIPACRTEPDLAMLAVPDREGRTAPGRSGGADGDGDGVLAAEREHLRAAREYLRLMRENVLSLPAMAGDRVSQEYLKADLHRRAEALRDLPGAPLFFGRLDYAGDQDAPEGGEILHIGRRHVHDPQGRPAVIDWRAPVARPFYQATVADPMNLRLRRRFGFSGDALTAYEDEGFRAGDARGDGAASRILIEEIERPRSGPMRDIVATIAPDQDDIVRADPDQTICVQGAPGTGKTAVGLHRIAYLLYAHQARMHRGGVLVIGPNKAFLSYIRGVLPALGELDVRQVTMTDLLDGVTVRARDSAHVARIKGDARMAGVLRAAVWSQLVEPAEPVMLVRGSRRWRVPAFELAGLMAELRSRGVRYGSGRDMFGHRIAHAILTRMEAAGEACDDRTHESVRRSRPVRETVDLLWPKVDPVRVVMRLLSDPAALARAADGILSPEEQRALAWARVPRGPASAPWTAADAVLVDEAADVVERAGGLSHVVVDEAQDLSPMECRAIGRRCGTGSVTVLGDLAQGTAPAAAADWAHVLAHLGKAGGLVRTLDTGYRVPRQILEYAGRLLPSIAPGLLSARSLRQDPGSLVVSRVAPGLLAGELARVCARALAVPGSVAVIGADAEVAALSSQLSRAGLAHAVLDTGATLEHRLVIVPATLAKGLEFDHVIAVEPDRIVAAEPRGLQRLYVTLTRAVSRLTVLHTGPLPRELADGARPDGPGPTL